MEIAQVFDIQKFCLHDGPGIRTAVFLKGCPLRCIWCHNPESQSGKREMLFSRDKCRKCGACASSCPKNLHSMAGGERVYLREGCLGCGECAKSCPYGAIEACGRLMTANEVLGEVLKDRGYFDNSGGGITLTGGEPMASFPFSLELLRQSKVHSIHTAMETCGFATREHFAKIAPYVDLFLYDVKTVNEEKHLSLTGKPNAVIFENLAFLDGIGAKTVLRCPLVPGLNDTDGELKGIALLASGLKNVSAIELEPYHPLGVAKALRLGRQNPYEGRIPTAEDRERWRKTVAGCTTLPVLVQ